MRLALLIACLLCAAVWGVEGAVTDSTADDPNNTYYLRTGRVPPAEAHPMDARLRAISDAFGGGDYERTRDLAQALLDATEDPALRSEAAAFIVESYLAAGNFAAAGAVAEDLGDSDGLTRISQMEADYEAEVGSLQHVVATTDNPAEAARAQLATAQAHRSVGRLDLAVQSYRKVVERYPKEAQAGTALKHLAAILSGTGRTDEFLSIAKVIFRLHPRNSGLLSVAALTVPAVAAESGHFEEAAQLLRQLTVDCEGKAAAGWAECALGELLAAQDRAKEAAAAYRRAGKVPASAEEAERSLAWIERREAMRRRHPGVSRTAACVSCADGRLAFQQGHYEEAVAALERALTHLSWRRSAWHRCMMLLGQCHDALGDSGAAVAAYRAVVRVVPDRREAAKAQLHVAQCLLDQGLPQAADDAYRKVADIYPDSRYARYAAEQADPCHGGAAEEMAIEREPEVDRPGDRAEEEP